MWLEIHTYVQTLVLPPPLHLFHPYRLLAWKRSSLCVRVKVRSRLNTCETPFSESFSNEFPAAFLSSGASLLGTPAAEANAQQKSCSYFYISEAAACDGVELYLIILKDGF